MATKKSSAKSAPEKSLLNKIAGEVGHIAGNIAVGKDHLLEIAGEAIDSVKEKLHITTKKKATTKKAVKAMVKKAVSKLPIAKKTAKPAASKKAAPAKKATKKVAKKKR